MKKKIIMLFGLGAIIYSCSQSLYMPAVNDSSEQSGLMEGRKLYVSHCSGCHNLHFPKEYTADQWKGKLNDMQQRAKISDQEKNQIYRYLTSQP